MREPFVFFLQKHCVPTLWMLLHLLFFRLLQLSEGKAQGQLKGPFIIHNWPVYQTLLSLLRLLLLLLLLLASMSFLALLRGGRRGWQWR